MANNSRRPYRVRKRNRLKFFSLFFFFPKKQEMTLSQVGTSIPMKEFYISIKERTKENNKILFLTSVAFSQT